MRQPSASSEAFDDARFDRALKRAKDKIAHYLPLPAPLQRLVLKAPGQLLCVNIADIDWIEAAGYYACLHVDPDTHEPAFSQAGSGSHHGPVVTARWVARNLSMAVSSVVRSDSRLI